MTLLDPHFDIVESDSIVAIDYAVGHLFDENDTSAMFDVEEHDSVCFAADHLREVADHIDRVAGREAGETGPKESGNGWDPDEDVHMTNRTETAGLVNANAIGKIMDHRSASVLVDADFLRQALDVAEILQSDDGRTKLWVSVQRDRPIVMTPYDADTDLAVSLAPVKIPEGSDRYEPSPTEDL